MLSLNHKKLDVWKLSIEFVSDIYSLTEDFPKKEIFLLSNQLRRSSISISSNIAEGSSRKTPNERRRFFEISRSSLVEIDTQIEIAKRIHYVNERDLAEIECKINRLFAMLSKLIFNTK